MNNAKGVPKCGVEEIVGEYNQVCDCNMLYYRYLLNIFLEVDQRQIC